ncbi:hypothetical protein SAMN04490186_5323 [Pseudomonas grimontii]|jgi:hypothetical protein|uniref:Putative adhesin Stv domain-containing protein n=1 Tax=Pseudomonas grimontii TaxID=129847 RepID=A0A1H1I8K5_9PSED|nr:hypothetical protein [Pseudomonas grimontii]TWR66670.1 hypothetical protein FIV39_12300 [Pseudomonas grimontii]SDR33962.1 hypothetical protein SAMN04490186_5323 [Pseudomonas grimontii]
MAIVLSGHGLACGEHSPPFALPKGFILYFWTADGIPIRDEVAARIEADPDAMNLFQATAVISRGGLVKNYWLMDSTNPPLMIQTPPFPHHQTVPGAGDAWLLSEIMASYDASGWGDLVHPTPVHWCACRSNLPSPPIWQQSLRPQLPAPNKPAWKRSF